MFKIVDLHIVSGETEIDSDFKKSEEMYYNTLHIISIKLLPPSQKEKNPNNR